MAVHLPLVMTLALSSIHQLNPSEAKQSKASPTAAGELLRAGRRSLPLSQFSSLGCRRRPPPRELDTMVGWQRCLRSVLRQVNTMMERNGRSSAIGYDACTKLYSPGQFAHPWIVSDISSSRIGKPSYQYLQHLQISSSRKLFAEEDANIVPISSPLTPLMGDPMKTGKKDALSKPLRVQAIKKDIRQSPKKVNLVAKLVRGMRVEDALLQLQVTVKRAAKTVYQVIHSARANAAHNHGLDPDRLLVDEAFVGKGVHLKRISYHAKGRSGIMVRPKCRLTVVVRETTPEEEAKIAKLRVSNFKKLTRRERQLFPHQLIETTPRWGRKREAAAPV